MDAKRGTNHRSFPVFFCGRHSTVPMIKQRGFTLPELIAVMVVVTVVAAVSLPKMWNSGFDEQAFAEETMAGLRYAQQSALAMQRTVCVAFAPTTVTFTYASVYGSAACGANLIPPGGGAAPYQVTAQHGGTAPS